MQKSDCIIGVEHVSKYFGDKAVLNDVNLSVRKGEFVTILGPSGCGKTTLLRLIAGFQTASEGIITIAGKDITQTPPHQRPVNTVFQKYALFPHLNVYNNIAFGVENAIPEEVVNAARIANAHDFILQTEHGYDTIIGDRGGKLSGGQRQRLSIARAVLKNPPIMILDEATSALDTESEKLVQEALDNLMKNRTSIVIAHRLSTIKNADLICVFHEGEIVEKGTHDELLSLNGIYTKLYTMQNF